MIPRAALTQFDELPRKATQAQILSACELDDGSEVEAFSETLCRLRPRRGQSCARSHRSMPCR